VGVVEALILWLTNLLTGSRKEIQRLKELNEQYEMALKISEVRYEDLRKALEVERRRLDEALDFDRELRKSIQEVKERRESDKDNMKPINHSHAGWRRVQSELQKKSKEQVDQIEAHYRKRIAEIEAEDLMNEDLNGDS
jgi:hypothetical protein